MTSLLSPHYELRQLLRLDETHGSVVVTTLDPRAAGTVTIEVNVLSHSSD
jgi:hypothetical protein